MEKAEELVYLHTPESIGTQGSRTLNKGHIFHLQPIPDEFGLKHREKSEAELILATAYTRATNMTEHLLASYLPRDYWRWRSGAAIDLPTTQSGQSTYKLSSKLATSKSPGFIRIDRKDTLSAYENSLWVFAYEYGHEIATYPYTISEEKADADLFMAIVNDYAKMFEYKPEDLDECLEHRMRLIDLIGIIKSSRRRN